MNYNKPLVAGKLRRWETYLNNYRLPAWEQIPDLGLYMEQVIVLLRQYLDYLPPELKEEEFITSAAINNYVRTKIMPEPIKKRYYRIHIAYLLVICTLKQGLSIALIRNLLPSGHSEAEICKFYTNYAARHALSASYFVQQVRTVAGPILDHTDTTPISTEQTEELIISSAIIGGFSRLLAEKLMLLADKDLSSGGSIEKLSGKDRKKT
ncbi:MAG: DUF1836 domain-containing protein [Oscillospiraceae bacterium]|nr:DUF1836 domain-containing protein [Oscillospiraceae bacterium]